MAYKLQIVDNTVNANFSVKYENLAKFERPEIEAKTTTGIVVKERTTYQGKILPQGSTNRQWTDEQGNVYAKTDLKFYYQGQEVPENTQTKVLTISGYQPLKNYTDNYVIATYYELFPHNNDMKKDFDKETARVTNLTGMKKLFDYLDQNNLVARGEFCPSSKGFVASDGYIRAVKFGNKWALELGVFKEEKVFEHLNEEVPAVPVQSATPSKRLKMV
jgi:hypothetical protein